MSKRTCFLLLLSSFFLFSCAAQYQRQHVSAQAALDSGDLDTAYELFLPIAHQGQAYAMATLAHIDFRRGNKDRSLEWSKLAALMGDKTSIDYLGDDAPMVLVFGTPLDDRILMCDLILDSARVLADNVALTFKIQTRYSSATTFSVNSIVDSRGSEAYLFGFQRNTLYNIPGGGFTFFTAVVSTKAISTNLSLNCDGTNTMVSIPLRNNRISAAVNSFAKADPSTKHGEVLMTRKGGVYEVPVLLNGVLKINFILDSGASEVFISPDVALTLQRTGTISDLDWLPGKTFQFADGSTAQSRRFLLRSIEIGGRVFENVPCAIANDISAPMLLGQSVLERLGGYRVDYENSVLVIE